MDARDVVMLGPLAGTGSQRFARSVKVHIGPCLDDEMPEKKVKWRAPKKQADILWSEVIRLRDKYKCQHPGCSRAGVQAHHIFGRGYNNTRHDIQNGILLCKYHHKFWAHGKPEEFRDFITKRLGEKTYEELKIRAYSLAKPDYKMAIVVLEEIKKSGV